MTIKNILSKEKGKLILSVGDEGAILTCMEGKRMAKRVFAESPSSQELLDVISNWKDSPIYILVDVVDQAYVSHSIPPVSRINMSKLISKKLERDFEESDIKAALSLGRDKDGGKKDWNYMLISARNAPPLSEWINVAAELPNPFGGIYFLPLESTPYLQDIKNAVGGSKSTPWHILVSHNRIGGFRQVVFKDGKLIFTRIVQPIGGRTADVVAGNIEQETLNTIEYIRRLGFNEDKNLDVFIIASREVKDVLDESAFPSNSTVVITPRELAEKLGLENAAEPKDQFGDVVAAAYFANRRNHILKFFTEYTKSINKLYQMAIAARAVGAVLFFAILFSAISGVGKYGDLKEKIKIAEQNKIKAEEEFAEAEKSMKNFKENPEKIADISSLNKKILIYQTLPIQFLSDYATIKGFNTQVETIKIELRRENGQNSFMTSSFGIGFLSDGGQLEQLFDDIELFAGDVRRKFSDYEVSFSGLPQKSEVKLNIAETSEKSSTSNIVLVIKGPKTEPNTKKKGN